MIKDNQKLLNKFLVLLDGVFVIAAFALAYFLKGEASFRYGIYEETVDNLNKSLIYHTDTEESNKLAVSAYNLLGLMFSFMGYEILALENYFYR